MSGSNYASSTKVSCDRTLLQLKNMLELFGADQFGYATSDEQAIVQFRCSTRMVRFVLQLPSVDDKEIAFTPTGKVREDNARRTVWEQACRAKWRSLYLLVKALLVAIEDGLIDFDRAFLHDLVTPNGRTVGEQLMPNVQSMIESGKKATLMLPGGS